MKKRGVPMHKDERPQKGPWAPGHYINLCMECQEEFMGDKLARMCANCAYDAPLSEFEEKAVNEAIEATEEAVEERRAKHQNESGSTQ